MGEEMYRCIEKGIESLNVSGEIQEGFVEKPYTIS